MTGDHYKRGMAVYFHHLHEGIVPQKVAGPDEKGDYTFSVEGKPRRMIVLGMRPSLRVETIKPPQDWRSQKDCMRYILKGYYQYLVLSVQSIRPACPNLPLPDLLERNKLSYVDLRSVSYPEQCVAQDKESPPRVIEAGVMDHIDKELIYKGLGYELEWGRG